MRSRVPFLVKCLSIIVLPMVVYEGFNAHLIEALLLGVFLTVASRAFSARALLITVPFSVFLLLRTGQSYSRTAGSPLAILACYLVMACIEHHRGRLVEIQDRHGSLRTWLVPKLRSWCMAISLCALGALLFRNTSVVRALGWAFAYGLLYRSMASFVCAPVSQRRNTFANVALLLFSTAFCLLFTEVALRFSVADSHHPTRVMQPDPEYLFLLEPNARGSWDFLISDEELLPLTMNISPQGFRDRTYGPKQENELRILMLGDSHMLGASVELEDSVPKQLERLLQLSYPDVLVSVINAGIMAAGPIQELGMLRKHGIAMEPDIVMLELYPANDIGDSLEWVGKTLQAYHDKWQDSLTAIRRASTFPHRIERWAQMHSRLYSALDSLIPEQHLLVSVFEGLRVYPQFVPPQPLENSGRVPGVEPDLRDWYPELAEGFALLKEYVYEIHDECRAHQMDFVAYVMPSFLDLDDSAWQWATGDSGLYERHKALHLTEQFFCDEGFACCPIRDMLRCGHEPQEVFYPLDGHCTPLGNRLIAQRLCNYLVRQHFPNHPPRVLEGRVTPAPELENPDALCVPTLENARCARTRPPNPPR